MKSLVPLMCFFAASASQYAWSDNDFSAYRMGNYNQAAESLMTQSGKDPVADYYLGRLYLYGYGQLKNTDLAMRYFLKSAEKGYLPAIIIMGKYNLMHDKNPEQAVRWFKQAAADGDVQAQLFMAAAYLYGIGVSKNVDTAAHYYIDAAKNGNALAQYAVAENFIDSKHSSNNKLGIIWLTKSANNGNPKALTKLGSLYLTGTLVEKNTDKGLALINQAMTQNDAAAFVVMGNYVLSQGDAHKALDYFNKAAEQKLPEAYMALAHAYLQEKSPIYDATTGFAWTLKAAQAGLLRAEEDLSGLYQKGIGTAVNPTLAQQWHDKAVQDEKKKPQLSNMALAALWLSNGKTDNMKQTSYQMDGILGAWTNPLTLVDNSYNQPPQMQVVTEQRIFNPHFELIQPNDIAIDSYYDALMTTQVGIPDNQWTYPLYRLNPLVESLERLNSPVMSRNALPVPYLDANYSDLSADTTQLSLMDLWTEGWQKQANYNAVFSQMYFRAILGDPQSQFEIGQMFQYGIGIAQNDQAATVFYQNAADQQHLGAEYNLGLLFLQHAKDAKDYQSALNWLTDSAFKGNREAQYVLAHLLTHGVAGADGTQYIQPRSEQALSMLYLSAANGYGPAEYQLADYLAHEKNDALTVAVKQHKIGLIRQLYAGAAHNGISQALLPLAYYNAMDKDRQKQEQAFTVAYEQANNGDEKAALLLGMLYDRGIGTSIDPAKAIYWYQRAGLNPVSEFIIGTYTVEGKGLVADKDAGTELLQQAANGQFSYAYLNNAVLKQQSGKPFVPDLLKAYELANNQAGIVLADYYLAENTQHADPQALRQAKEIYTKLAEKGDQYAQLKLAYMLEKGLGIPMDPVAALRWLTASAEQGNTLSDYLLGQFYQSGALGAPDYALAKEWYQKAAQQMPQALVALGFIAETVDDNYARALDTYQQASSRGDLIADYDLALMYMYGKGIPVDYTKAHSLFKQAADQGMANALNQLGVMAFYGLGQERNNEEALSFYKKAAALGNSSALYTLGLFSETGVTTKINFQDAVKYYQASAQQGNEKAMLALARMYHHGLGVKQDLKMSMEFYQKLAERQNAYAQYQLGTFYLNGTAGQPMLDKAKQLFEQASENGCVQARQALQRLNAQNQGKVSFIQSIPSKHDEIDLSGKDVSRVYLAALNEWNRGNEVKSRLLIQQIVTQYPSFIPAQQMYKQLIKT